MSSSWLSMDFGNNHIKWPDHAVDWFLKKKPKQSTGSVVVDWFLKKEPKQSTGFWEKICPIQRDSATEQVASWIHRIADLNPSFSRHCSGPVWPLFMPGISDYRLSHVFILENR